MLAAFLLTLSCTMAPAAPGVPAHDECQTMELQSWTDATMAEIEDCANMADDLLQLNKFGSRCEVVPMAATGETADVATLANAHDNLRSNEPADREGRVRYGGNWYQRDFDQTFTF
jgi:hypothetical protein